MKLHGRYVHRIRSRADSAGAAPDYWDGIGGRPPMRRPNLLSSTIRLIVEPLLSWLFALHIEGGASIASRGAAIIVGSHRSDADILFMACTTRRPINYMGRYELFRPKLARALLSRLGAFPVDRDRPDRRALERAIEVLGQGCLLGVFAEGGIESGPDITAVKKGVAWLSVRCQVPVIPVGIGGSYLVRPVNSHLFRRAPVRVVVGQPLHPPQRQDRSAITAFQSEVTSALQRAFDAAGGEGDPVAVERRRREYALTGR